MHLFNLLGRSDENFFSLFFLFFFRCTSLSGLLGMSFITFFLISKMLDKIESNSHLLNYELQSPGLSAPQNYELSV